MSIQGGPYMANSGLGLYFDTASPKSYKGEPTVNANNYDVTNTMGTDYSPVVTQSIESGSFTYNGKNTKKVISNGTWNIYANSGGQYSNVTSSIWCLSFKIKYAAGNVPSFAQGYIYTNAISTVAVVSASAIDNGWYQCYCTYNNTAGYPTLTGFTGAPTGTLYLSDWQVEAKTHYTPFAGVSGSRSYTGSLIDLSGNETIDLTSASFNSSASIVYASSYVYSTGSNLELAGDKTLAHWVNLSADSSGCGFAAKANTVTFGMATAYGFNVMGFQAIAWNSVNSPQIAKDATRDVGKWIYVAAVQSGATRYIYAFDNQGVRQASYSGGTHTWVNGLPLAVGGSSAGASPCPSGTKIDMVAAYTRALSYSELLLNFNSTKTRYGL